MKQVIAILYALLFNSAIVFAQQATDDFAGKWKTEEGNIVTISKNDQKQFVGVDYKKRLCLYNIRFEKGVWAGKAENHDEGRKADCEIYLLDDKLKIVAHKGFFSKTFFWTKVK